MRKDATESRAVRRPHRALGALLAGLAVGAASAIVGFLRITVWLTETGWAGCLAFGLLVVLFVVTTVGSVRSLTRRASDRRPRSSTPSSGRADG